MGSSYAAAGDVHGVSREHVPAIREAFGDDFGWAVVVRDPLARIHSQMALFEEFRRVGAWDLDYVDRLAETHGLTALSQDPRGRMFIHAANMLNAVVEEREVGPIFRAESLTSDPEVLGEFITTLTAGAVGLERDWLRRAVGQPRVNQHNGGDACELDPSEIEVVRKVVRAEAWDAYAEIGYPPPSFIDLS